MNRKVMDALVATTTISLAVLLLMFVVNTSAQVQIAFANYQPY